MNYWLHRISHIAQLSYPLLDKGFLTIGFSDFANDEHIDGIEFIDKVISNDWSFFEQSFKDIWGTPLARTRYNLWRFLRFEKGDIVVVPSYEGTFIICKIIDDTPKLIRETFNDNLKTWSNQKILLKDNLLKIENGSSMDLGFARNVEVLYRDISREKYADSSLTARMKIFQTNAEINDIKNSVEICISNFKQNKPIDLHSSIIDQTTKPILNLIRSELNPDKFERLVLSYFKTIGASNAFIPSKNESGKEGDADIVATFEKLKLIVYTQVKFYTDKADDWAVEQIKDYVDSKESSDIGYNKMAWVISSADSYSEQAEKMAAENNIQLIDGAEFTKMLMNAGISLLDTKL